MFQTAKMASCLYFVISLVFIPIVIIVSLAKPNNPFPWLLLFMPLIYAVVGFIFTALATFVYNLLAKRLGGIEFNLEQPGEPVAKQ